MSNKYKEFYGKDFYEQNLSGMSRSAAVILGQVYKLYNPKSVIDIGCGQGAWLNVAESLGATTLKGIDGDWVNNEKLCNKNIDFIPVNLADSVFELNERYDLCISLEVAEHLPEDSAEDFVKLLCQASDTILFGAAIKYQGGTNHINEQWQSYWIKLFNSRGYECLDCFRGAIWDDTSVEWWYKQNTFLLIGPNNKNIRAEELRLLEKPIIDVAHPINYENKIKNYQAAIRRYEKKISAYQDEINAYENKLRIYRDRINYPTLRFCAGCMKRWFSIIFRRIIGRDQPGPEILG